MEDCSVDQSIWELHLLVIRYAGECPVHTYSRCKRHAWACFSFCRFAGFCFCEKERKPSLLPFYTLIFAHSPLSTSSLSRRFFKLWSHSQYSVGGWKKEWHDGGLHGFHSINLLHQTTVPIFLSVHIISTGSTWWMAWISHISPWHTCTVKILFDLSKGPIWWWAPFTRPTWLSSKGEWVEPTWQACPTLVRLAWVIILLMPSLLSPLWVEC